MPSTIKPVMTICGTDRAFDDIEGQMDEVPEDVADIAYDWQAMNAIAAALNSDDGAGVARRLDDIAEHVGQWLLSDEERRSWLRLIEAVQCLVYERS